VNPVNVESLDTFELRSRTTDDAEWVGQFFAYGGSGAAQSTVIYFAMPPGKRLGLHTDTAEETPVRARRHRRATARRGLQAGARR
jgi:hypothetical protein